MIKSEKTRKRRKRTKRIQVVTFWVKIEPDALPVQVTFTGPEQIPEGATLVNEGEHHLRVDTYPTGGCVLDTFIAVERVLKE